MRSERETEQPVRIERDTMGEVPVPEWARWGAQTQRAVDNFPISGEPIDRALIAALGEIKAAASETNAELGVLAPDVAAAIADAAREVATGLWDEHFPVDVFQTGSGTSSNMNANEVIASIASERLGRPVHPNDDVNRSQSSNDVFPSAIHIAAVALAGGLVAELDLLTAALSDKAAAFATVVKAGRTHLMDATPVTLGQEFGGYAAQVRAARARIAAATIEAGELPLGGTAVGTGINAPEGFAAAAIGRLAVATGLVLVEATDHFAAQGARDGLVGLSGQLRALAVALTKIANDLRWMASGPRTGLGEIRLPDLQPGSSIMPGKVNPVLCEMLTQVAAQVIGNDATVGFAGSQGNFELNVYLPVIARNLLQSLRLLTAASSIFRTRCVEGIEADVERCRAHAEASPQVATALNPLLGYETVAALVKESVATGRPLRDLVREKGLLDGTQLDRALDVLAMAHPHPTKGAGPSAP